MIFKLNIQKKMILAIMGIALFVLVVLETMFLRMSADTWADYVLNTASTSTEQLAHNYEKELASFERMSETLAEYSTLNNYLTTGFSKDEDAFVYYIDNIHQVLSAYNNLEFGTAVRIYHNYQDVPNFSYEITNRIPDFPKQYFFENFLIYNQGIWVHDNAECLAFQSAYSYYLPVYARSTPHNLCFVVGIHLSEAYLNSLIAKADMEQKLVCITDQEGNILTTNFENALGEEIGDLFKNDALIQESINGQIDIDNKSYHYDHAATENLQIFQFVDYGLLYKSQRSSLVLLLGVGIVVFAVVTILATTASNGITKGIKELNEKLLILKQNGATALSVHELEGYQRDEIKQIENTFDNMILQLDSMYKKAQIQERNLIEVKLLQQQAEMEALQRQINPHYLFNTLESIRMHLIVRGNEKEAEIVKLFAESIRRYVNKGENFVSLFEEIEFIRKYMKIQSYCTSDRIKFRSVIDESVLNHYVPKFLIQPLVENAVCHGADQKNGEVEVLLRIEASEAMLIVQVEDGGIGMDEAEVKKLRTNVYDLKNEKSVGLCNVYKRMTMIYGEHAKLLINSKKGIGTRVELHLPIKEVEENV